MHGVGDDHTEQTTWYVTQTEMFWLRSYVNLRNFGGKIMMS